MFNPEEWVISSDLQNSTQHLLHAGSDCPGMLHWDSSNELFWEQQTQREAFNGKRWLVLTTDLSFYSNSED